MEVWTLEVYIIGMCGLVFIGVILELAYGVYRYGIGPTPSTRIAREAIIQICYNLRLHRDAEDSSDRPFMIYELGSGWGGLSHELARMLSRRTPTRSWHIIGYEVMYTPYLISKVYALIFRRISRLHKTQTLQFHRTDLLHALERVQSYDLCVCYLCPTQMKRISVCLKDAESRPSITLVSLTFALPHFTPSECYTLPTLYRDVVYVYQL